MTAIRSVRAAEGKFVQLANTAGQDPRLSLQARGIIFFVLSLPPDQTFTAKWLESQVPNGREAIRSALAELRECGYMRRTKRQNERGHWEWEQVISDAPVADEEAEPPSDGNPSPGEAASGQPSDKRSNTEHPKDVGPEDLASRHARAKKRASTQRTVQDAIDGVRAAVAATNSQADADGLSDEECLGLYFSYVRGRRPGDIAAYLGKIFGDAPYIDTFLSNSEAACLRCQKWETDCECPAA